MYLKRILKLTFILFLCLSLISLLYFWSNKKRENEFKRLFPSHILTDQKITDLIYNSFYISGRARQTVYLGNITSPEYVSEYSIATEKLTHYLLTLNEPEILKKEILILAVDSPYYYLYSGNNGLVLKSTGTENSLTNINSISLPNFSAMNPISGNSFVLRTYNSHLKITTLQKTNIVANIIQENPTLLQKQVDGRFDVDGMMQVDPYSRSMVYLYYYRNQFIVTDTNLNLIFRGHTIDSNTKAKFSVAYIDKGKTSMISAPQFIINKKLRMNMELIFIQSGLISKSEPPDLLKKYAIIDVYSLKNGRYKFSFYVPKYLKEEISDFIVLNDRLVYLSGHFLLDYHLNLPLDQ